MSLSGAVGLGVPIQSPQQPAFAEAAWRRSRPSRRRAARSRTERPEVARSGGYAADAGLVAAMTAISCSISSIGVPSRSRTAEGMDAARARKPLPSAVTVTMTLRSSAGSRSRRTYPRGGIWSHLDQIGRPSSKLKRASIATLRTSISC